MVSRKKNLFFLQVRKSLTHVFLSQKIYLFAADFANMGTIDTIAVIHASVEKESRVTAPPTTPPQAIKKKVVPGAPTKPVLVAPAQQSARLRMKPVDISNDAKELPAKKKKT